MVTIDASPITFTTAAKLSEALSGVSDEQLRAFLQNPGRKQELVNLITAPTPIVPSRLDAGACRRLIDEMFPAKYDEDDGRTRATVSFPLYSDERELLSETEQVRRLLGLLTKQQLEVVIKRGGLTGQPEIDAFELGQRLNLSRGQVNRVRGTANRVMRKEIFKIVKRLRRCGD